MLSKTYYAALVLSALLPPLIGRGESRLLFQFDTQIVEITGDSSLLPTGAEVGSTIAAEYAVSLADLQSGADRVDATASFKLGGNALQAANNSLGIAFVLGSPVPTPNDALTASCDSPTDVLGCRAGVWPEEVGYVWSPSLTLIGDDGILPAIVSLTDENVWNQLDGFRELRIVVFPEGEDAGSPALTIVAEVGSVSVVPEPSCGALLSVAMASLTFRRKSS